MTDKTLIQMLVEQDERLKKLESGDTTGGKKWSFKMKIPGRIASKAKRNKMKAAALWIGPNRRIEWKLANEKDGLWWIDVEKQKVSFAYEESSVFTFNKTPIIILYSWRLLPVGGKAEEFQTRIIGGEDDQVLAEHLGIKTFGQRTIIRGIEQAELEKEQKKGGSMTWIWIALIAVGAIYLLSRFLGK
jgi:hypothetical protein